MAAKEYRAFVSAFQMLTPTVFQLDLKTEQPRFEFEGGQFISVVIPCSGPNGRDLRRAYSIASSPEKEEIELCVKIVEGGPGTTYLKKLRPGDHLKIFAPYGNFLYHPKPGRSVCFVSTGTGIAPFRSMIFSRTFQDNLPEKTWCLLGVRSEDEILYQNEFGALDFVQWVPAVSRPTEHWKGFRGRVTDYLRLQDDRFPWKNTDFYLCGSGAMISEVKEILASKEVEKSSIHQEVYYKE